MPLTFGNAARAWDAAAQAVTFAAEDNRQPVKCSINADALRQHFGLSGNDGDQAIRAFDRCRMVIEEAASRKYDRWKLASSGEVSLRARDFGR